MKCVIPDYYKEFECIGGACTSSCCSGKWKIGVDEEIVAMYKNIEGSFGDKLRENLVTWDGKTFLKMLQKGNEWRCAFLKEDNLCEVYQQLGGENLCYTCRVYPRKFLSFGDVQVVSLMFSCPEVIRILLEHAETIEFWVEDSSQSMDKADVFDTDWELFNEMMQNFTSSVMLVQNRKFPMSDRLKLLVLYNEELEKHSADKNNRDSLFDVFSKEDELAVLIAGMHSFSRSVSNKLNAFLSFYKKTDDTVLHRLPQICTENLSNGENIDAFCEEFNTGYKEFLENYCVCYLSQYYLSAGDGEVKILEKVKFLIYILNLHHCYLYFQTDGSMERLTKEVFIDTFVKISRAVEHGIGYEDHMRACYSQKERDDISYLLSLI